MLTSRGWPALGRGAGRDVPGGAPLLAFSLPLILSLLWVPSGLRLALICWAESCGGMMYGTRTLPRLVSSVNSLCDGKSALSVALEVGPEGQVRSSLPKSAPVWIVPLTPYVSMAFLWSGSCGFGAVVGGWVARFAPRMSRRVLAKAAVRAGDGRSDG